MHAGTAPGGKLESWRSRRKSKTLFRRVKQVTLLLHDSTKLLEAICRRLGFTFVLASKAGCAAIWERDSGFINWIPVNLQHQLDFPSHSVLSPVSSTSGGWQSLVLSWAGSYISPLFTPIMVPRPSAHRCSPWWVAHYS